MNTHTLMQAAENGDTAVVGKLLAQGVDINLQDKLGHTALMFAAGMGHTATLKLLLDGGADHGIRNRVGTTALMRAVAEGHTDAAQELLDRGADVNVKRQDGTTALALAASFGHAEIVRALLDKGADVSAKDFRHSTALDYASSKDYTNIVQLLRAGEPVIVDAPETNQTVKQVDAPNEANRQHTESLNEGLDATEDVPLPGGRPAKLKVARGIGNGRIVIKKSGTENDDKTVIKPWNRVFDRRWLTTNLKEHYWRFTTIAALIMFIASAVSGYVVARKISLHSANSQTGPSQSPGENYRTQPVPRTPPLAEQSGPDIQPDLPRPDINSKFPTTSSNAADIKEDTFANNEKRNGVRSLSPQNTDTSRITVPTVISLAQQDDLQKEQREEETQSLPSSRSNNEPQKVPEASIPPSQGRSASDSFTPSRSSTKPSASPKKKVIQWP